MVTVVVQSSSVTTGLVVLLTSSGLLPLGQALPILLGANIGTTSTSLLATWRMGLHARRAAVAHVLFNVGGAVMFLPLLGALETAAVALGGDAAQQVANAHLVFNVAVALVFLVAVRPFAAIVERLVPGEEEEIVLETRYLPTKLPSEIGEAFGLVEAELANLFEVTRRLFLRTLDLFSGPAEPSIRRAKKLEELNDYLDERIEGALLDLSGRELNSEQAQRVVLLVRISNTLEQLGDTGAALGDLVQTARDTGIDLSEEILGDLREAGVALSDSFEVLLGNFPSLTPQQSEEHRASQRRLRALINEKYSLHLRRLASETSYAPAFVVEGLSAMETASSQLREIRKQLESPVRAVD